MEGRRRITLYDQMTAGNSTLLADLIFSDNVVLTDQKNDGAAAAATTATADSSATAEAVAADGANWQLSQQSRTLIDILHEDEQHNNNETTSDRKSKKAFNFMDKLRLKLTLNSKSNYNTNNNNDDSNNELVNQQGNTHQQPQQQNDSVSEEPQTAAAEVSVAGAAVGVSLMDLLEETDVETVASNPMSDAEFEVVNECDEGGGEEEEGTSVVERNCCVCMVRHKGAAFIPCGHTFCRACSREVWVSRGNCPLCNNLILEILDIF